MRVLGACSLGGAGHFEPLRVLLDAARARGDETLVVTTPGLARLVQRSGHAFVAGGEPAETEIGPIREALPVLPRAEASVLGNRELFGRLATEAMLPAMTAALEEWCPDLVIRDPCEYASSVVAPRLGIPTAQAAISLADVEQGSIEVAAEVLESHRRGMVDELVASPYLSRFPTSWDPSTFPDTRRIRAAARQAGRLPDWWRGSQAPLVYVTLGSVIPRLSFAPVVYRTVLAALADLHVRVLVTIGGLDPSLLGPLPSHVHVEAWVDQDDALRETDLVICHGGSGTVLGVLAAGVPLIVLPHFGDQFANGSWVAASGAGSVIERPIDDAWSVVRDDDIAEIGATVTRLHRDPSSRDAARRVGAEMGRAADAVTVLGRLMSS